MQLLPRGFKAGHVIKDFKSTGEVCQAPGRLRKPGIRNNGRKENRKWPAEVGWPNSTQQKKRWKSRETCPRRSAMQSHIKEET